LIDVTLGIDVGGTNTIFGLVTENGKIEKSWSIPTKANNDVTSLMLNIKKELANSSELLINYNILGIGIGAPNANYYTGVVDSPPNLSWGTVNLKKIIEDTFNLKCAITNDANAAAMGEMLFGAAKGMTDFIEITLGTGLGSGIVINGNVLYGKTGFAGELGHEIVIENGRKCGCDRSGCLETYASATGILRTAHEVLAASDKESLLRNMPESELSSYEIFKAASQEDELALEIFDSTAKILAKSLANSVTFSSPEAIILFGGLAESGEVLLVPLRKYFNKYLLNIFKGTCEIIKSTLPMGESAILGSSALIWNEIKKESFVVE